MKIRARVIKVFSGFMEVISRVMPLTLARWGVRLVRLGLVRVFFKVIV